MSQKQAHILILGFGLSGVAAADLALQRGAKVTILDCGGGEELQQRAEALRHKNAKVHLDWSPAQQDLVPTAVDLVVMSPGIAADSVLAQVAATFKCPVIGELEFGFRYCSCPILAVTGTNGKTTTVELTTHCLRQAGLRVQSAGNIGVALSAAVQKSAQLDVLVVEVSSFQLEAIEKFAPLAAALLNISSDHLDRYASLAEYTQAKLRLFANIQRAECVIMRHDLLTYLPISAALPPITVDGPVIFGLEDMGCNRFFLDNEGWFCRREANQVNRLLQRQHFALKGGHNVENALAALALCEAAGVPAAVAVKGLRSFTPSRHRLELVEVHNGIRFINDSKSTNPDSLSRAIAAVAGETSGEIYLIAGGLDKGLSFTELGPLLAECVAEAFLIGSCRHRLAKQWADAVSCKLFMSLTAAIDAAIEVARPGDTVLLSPGCASQDMFKNYAERGDAFCAHTKRRIQA